MTVTHARLCFLDGFLHVIIAKCGVVNGDPVVMVTRETIHGLLKTLCSGTCSSMASTNGKIKHTVYSWKTVIITGRNMDLFTHLPNQNIYHNFNRFAI